MSIRHKKLRDLCGQPFFELSEALMTLLSPNGPREESKPSKKDVEHRLNAMLSTFLAPRSVQLV